MRVNRLDQFLDRVDQLEKAIKAAPLAEWATRILVPGDLEAEKTERRLREGIPVAGPIRQELVALGRRLGVPFE